MGTVSRFMRNNVLGLVAIFIALGGTAIAVQKAPKNSVISKSIKNGQVKAADLKAGAVNAQKLAPAAVGTAALADGSVAPGKLAFDPATQTELGAVDAELDAVGSELDTTQQDVTDLDAEIDGYAENLITPGAVNAPGNPVDWTKLANVPSEIADGDDDNVFANLSGFSSDPAPGIDVQGMSAVRLDPLLGIGAITDLTGGVAGQRVTLISESAGYTIADGGNFRLAGNWVPGDADTITLVRSGTRWWEVARSDN